MPVKEKKEPKAKDEALNGRIIELKALPGTKLLIEFVIFFIAGKSEKDPNESLNKSAANGDDKQPSEEKDGFFKRVS